MCGIAGYVDFGERGPARATLDAMAQVLRRRGPDAQGVLLDGACGLAHTRLSIIDIAGSPQPMRVNGSDLSLVYNGELYNYQALRDEMRREGVAFETNGDTEVVLRWVGHKWEQALGRFDGMFAFAAWDRRRGRLLLARDPIGEKPLFYATPRPGLLVFGSEIKAVLAHPEVQGEMDLASLRQVLRFRAVYGSGSMYGGIRQLEPGTFLEFSRAGSRSGRFHDLLAEVARETKRQRNMSDEQLVREARELLQESIRERLIADAPVGAFLSGGLDSSLIVASMQRIRQEQGGGGGGGERVRTYAVGFADDEYSELPFARQVADRVGTQHTEVSVSLDQYVKRLAELTACRDAPLSEPADVAIAEMSRVARQSVKVVLSGEGADEVFAGYPKYAFASPSWPLRAALHLVGPPWASRLAGIVGLDQRRALVAARSLVLPRELDRLVQWFSYLDRSDLSGLLPGLGWSDAAWGQTTEGQARTLSQLPQCSPLARMQLIDCLTWLPGNLLERGDRMTMAEGLELRPPFLDKQFVAFGLALRDRLKRRGRTGKWIIRQLAGGLVPEAIHRRRKWGFRVPLARWFRGGMKEMLHDYLTARNGLCGTYGDPRAVRRLLEEHDSGHSDRNLPLWTLLTAEIFFQDVYATRRREMKPMELGEKTSIELSPARESSPAAPSEQRSQPMISIIVPAFNEEDVIARSVRALSSGAREGELEVVVVCNGCHDRTAEVARGCAGSGGAVVRVIETTVASKVHAMNLGDAAATGWPRFYVDADVVLPLEAVRKLARHLQEPGVFAVAPDFRMELTDCSWAVRAFYDINHRLPSSREGIGGSGVYALSEAGRRRFPQFPEIIADDAFVRVHFTDEERKTDKECWSTVYAPRTLEQLIAIKCRSHFGTWEVRRLYPQLWANKGSGNMRMLLFLGLQFWHWPKLAVYGYTKVMARLRAVRRLKAGQDKVWERDQTSRQVLPARVPEARTQPSEVNSG